MARGSGARRSVGSVPLLTRRRRLPRRRPCRREADQCRSRPRRDADLGKVGQAVSVAIGELRVGAELGFLGSVRPITVGVCHRSPGGTLAGSFGSVPLTTSALSPKPSPSVS